ncbi:MAG: DUF167 domain-containing protein [Azoarcus sp.]|jgi:uncharacterized protein (TIGR00251 family)|nr:DUF167 domain-containing protein [Azoarcus sp.]
MSNWLTQTPDGSLILCLHVQPGAKQTGFAGLHGNDAKLRLAAPPVDGKANAALCAYLAKICGASKSEVQIISGETSRSKRVRIAPAPDRKERLTAALAATEKTANSPTPRH